jgi:hypothetical protein
MKMEKITKEEFLKRFVDAEKSIVVLNSNADNSNYFEEYKDGLHAIKCGDAYIKDGRERVVVGVDGNYVELNDNAVQARIAKKLNDRAQEEMAQELERLRQLDPSRKLSLRVYE